MQPIVSKILNIDAYLITSNLRGDLSEALHNIKENSSAVERLDDAFGEVSGAVRLVGIQEEFHSVVFNVGRRHHLIHHGIILLVHLQERGITPT